MSQTKEELFKNLQLRDFRQDEPVVNSTHQVKAYIVITVSCFFLFLYMYAVFVSALVPDTGYFT